MLTLSPAEDPLRIRIGIGSEDLETLRSGIDRGLDAGLLAVDSLVARHDGSVLRATADETTVEDGLPDTHYFEFNAETLREIRKRLIAAKVSRCIQEGIAVSRAPLDTPEDLLYGELYEAELELKRVYAAMHDEPYPEPQSAVFRFPNGGY